MKLYARMAEVLARVVESNGAGAPVGGYAREYLIGAALARPRGLLLVHTRKGLELYREQLRARRGMRVLWRGYMTVFEDDLPGDVSF